jgi:hypothetical protein
LIILQIFYISSWQLKQGAIVTVEVCNIIVELAEKFVFLFLVKQFGTHMTVKTFILGNGDLVVVGTDDMDRQVFSFGVRTLN